jgi:LacI family transcriptional regulator
MADLTTPGRATDRGAPKYRALAEELEAQIRSGRYGVGDRLPPERELARAHGMTAMTARQALRMLTDQGLIRREQGRGTFVASTVVPSTPTATAPCTVCLLGLNPTSASSEDSVNWQPRMRRFQGIVDAAFQFGLSVQSQVEIDPTAPVRRQVEQLSRFSAVVLHAEQLTEPAMLQLHHLGVPVLAINCYADSSCCSRIHINSQHGAFAAVTHLIELGHTRIGMLAGDPVQVSMGERLAGYRSALAAHGLASDDALVHIEPRGRRQDGADAIGRLLTLPEPPTAVFAASDYRAVGALEALREQGMRVPDSLSVVGFDDLQEAAAAAPPLTTVRNPLYESGRLAVEMLSDILERDGAPEIRVEIMAPELVVRESTAPPPSGT